MKIIINIISATLVMIFLVVLTLPAIHIFPRIVTRYFPDTYKNLVNLSDAVKLHGYVDDVGDRPNNFIISFFDKSYQNWASKHFNAYLGFRGYLIRSFNEITFNIFREKDTSRIKILATKEHGLYSNLSIDSLNNSVLDYVSLTEKYKKSANKLLQVQSDLEKKGKFFIVVLASSKAWVYPDSLGKQYLTGGAVDIFKRAVNFADILHKTGVNVVDSAANFRKLTNKSLVILPDSGLHWSYYAGCLATQWMLDIARRHFHALQNFNCGLDVQSLPAMNNVDVDGYLLLNVWSDLGLIKKSSYPNITPFSLNSWRPRIVFIGDSFSDHMINAMQKGKTFSNLVFSSYFHTRSTADKNSGATDSEHEKLFAIRKKILSDINLADIIVLELVDYNVIRTNGDGYGFVDFYLQNIG